MLTLPLNRIFTVSESKSGLDEILLGRIGLGKQLQLAYFNARRKSLMSHKAYTSVLISLALSRTPAYTAR